MAFCPSCGRDIADDDRFCRACGKQINDTAPVAVESEPTSRPADGPDVEESWQVPQPKARRMRRPWLLPLVLAVVLVIVAGAVIVVQRKASDDRAAKQAAKAAAAKVLAAKIATQRTAASDALKPFKKLDSALTVGVVFADYGSYVQNAQFAFDSYSPTDPTGRQIRQDLAKAMKLYAVAGDAWNDAIQMKFTGNKTSGAYWIGRYPALKDQLKTGHVTATQVQQAAWAVASLQVAIAETGMGGYGGP